MQNAWWLCCRIFSVMANIDIYSFSKRPNEFTWQHILKMSMQEENTSNFSLLEDEAKWIFVALGLVIAHLVHGFVWGQS